MPRTHVPHRKMSTKKKVAASAAAVLIAALLLGGAFAWTDFTQAFTNIFHNHPEPDVLLHDDFTQNKNKDVYVENTGNTPVYVRIAFYEYLQVGNKVIVGDTSKTPAEAVKDKSTYEKHLWSPMPDAKGVQSKWNLPSDQYYDWYVTGAQKLYLPGTSEIGDPNFSGMSVNTTPTAAQGGNGNALQYTIDAMPVRTMAWWTSQTDTVKKYYKGWILDTDGYAYWSQKLMPGTATNLLLDNVLPKPGIVPDDNSYYAIDVRMQAANSTEAYKMYTDEVGNKNGASDDAMNWLDLDSKEPAQNPDDLKDKTDNAKGDGLTDAEIAALKAALEASPVDTDGITAIGIDNAKKAYDAAQAAQDALNEELNKANPDADKIEQLARAADSLEKLGDRISDQCTDGQLDAGDAVTVDGNGFAKVVDAATGDTLLNALNFPDPNLLALLTQSSGYDTGFFDVNCNTGSNLMHVNSIDTDPAGGDGKLSSAELSAVTEIYLVANGNVSSDSKIARVASLEGIELFPKLTTLQINSTEVSTVNPDKNSLLTNLAVSGSSVAIVNTANNPQLKELVLNGLPSLSNIDLSKNTKLTKLRLTALSCIRTIDATHFPVLQLLQCYADSNLTSINVRGLASLAGLSASNDLGLTTLDVTGCTGLVTLEVYVSNTADWYGTLGNGHLTTITGLTDCTALTVVNLCNESLSSLDISTLNFPYNSGGIQFYNNNLTSLKVPAGTLANWQNKTNTANANNHLKGNFGGTPSMTNPGDMTGVDVSKITE